MDHGGELVGEDRGQRRLIGCVIAIHAEQSADRVTGACHAVEVTHPATKPSDCRQMQAGAGFDNAIEDS
jgi:hypothetical protein